MGSEVQLRNWLLTPFGRAGPKMFLVAEVMLMAALPAMMAWGDGWGQGGSWSHGGADGGSGGWHWGGGSSGWDRGSGGWGSGSSSGQGNTGGWQWQQDHQWNQAYGPLATDRPAEDEPPYVRNRASGSRDRRSGAEKRAWRSIRDSLVVALGDLAWNAAEASRGPPPLVQNDPTPPSGRGRWIWVNNGNEDTVP